VERMYKNHSLLYFFGVWPYDTKPVQKWVAELPYTYESKPQTLKIEFDGNFAGGLNMGNYNLYNSSNKRLAVFLVPKEIKDYVLGLYGQAPAEINPEVKEKIIGDAEVVTVRPADLIEDQLPEIREEIKEYAKSDEDVLMYALFPQQAKDFLGRREDPFYDVPLQTVDVTLDLQ